MPRLWCGSGEQSSPSSAAQGQAHPDDALEERAGKLRDLDKLLATVGDFAARISAALKTLDESPVLLLDELGRVFPAADAGDVGQCAPGLVAELGALSEGLRARLQAGLSHVDKLERLISEARERSKVTQQVLDQRNSLWEPKDRADREAEALQRRFGKSFSLQEKKDRLQAKTAADEKYKKASADAEQALDGFLARRWSTTAHILAEACYTMDTIFREAQPLAEGSQKLAARLAGTPNTPAGGAVPGVFAVGQSVEVWSSSEQAWLRGRIEEIFAVASVDVTQEGGVQYKVPAGAIKVVHHKGFKYVQAEQIAEGLRPTVP